MEEDQILVDLLSAHENCTEYKLFTRGFKGFCLADFDGIVCWPPTQAGNTAVQDCPRTFSHATVARVCGADGVWDPDQSQIYSSCGLNNEHTSAMRKLYDYLRAPSAKVPAKWYLYQRHAECLDRINDTQPPTALLDDKLTCPMVFDGWSCWNFTEAGESAFSNCPKHITGFDPSRFAFRTCTENGTWFQHPDTGKPWSNYTTCVDTEDLKFRNIVNSIYISGYTLSFLALIISVIIFTCFRSLKCTRITIHVHLFISFALNNMVWLIWYRFVIGDLESVDKNEIWCQALHVLLQYLMLANYAWMFCEGLHLHLALVVVFVKDDIVIKWFYFVGWVLPGIISFIYAMVRVYSTGEIESCWMDDSYSTWILTAPVLLSMLCNCVFLVNVVRILLTRLHPQSANPASRGLQRAVRATLLLVPLFGLHHILLPFRPETRATGETFYQVFAACVVSLQGFCVAFLFCFVNGDVHSAFRTFFQRICRSRTAYNPAAAGCAMVVITQTHTNNTRDPGVAI